MKKNIVPLTVPKKMEREYQKNFRMATKGTGNLMMFAGDQKVEHLNDDFVGPEIPREVADPEHYFKIASKAHIGVFATQLGLLSRYAMDYRKINYLIKINSKTNLVKSEYQDPISKAWVDVDSVVEFKKSSKLNILGVGYTIYLGSWYESDMFAEAARVIEHAHQHGLITVIWMYPRGQSVGNEKDTHLIAGAAGVALCLGADFVKVNHPYTKNSKFTCEEFSEVVDAAGRTGVICVGGSKKDEKLFLKSIHDQINVSKTRGNAIGRNIYQRPLDEAVRMADAISSIVLHGRSADEAYEIFTGKKKLKVSTK